MFGHSLLSGLGISGVSTGIYAAVTNDPTDRRGRNSEYLSIFCIILIVSVLILFTFNGKSESLVTVNGSASPAMSGGKPPF